MAAPIVGDQRGCAGTCCQVEYSLRWERIEGSPNRIKEGRKTTNEVRHDMYPNPKCDVTFTFMLTSSPVIIDVGKVTADLPFPMMIRRRVTD